MKVTIAMDSFKGSLTSLEAGYAVRDGILLSRPDADISVLPLADGGEGTLEAIAPYIKGTAKTLTVTGPLGTPVSACYIFDEDSKTAYIEMAKASGLTLIRPEELDPYKTTSYGTGELIKDAISSGAGKIIVFIGGSATNDGGAGMLQALGAKLSDKYGNDIPGGASGLKDLFSVDMSGLPDDNISFVVASDVTNPLCGTNGASHVYGPQKGATHEMAVNMDNWLRSFADITGFDPGEKGTGAAGGMSFALKNFLGAETMPGADLVINITGASGFILNSDIVITGEGRMDHQTVNGKAPYKIMKLAKTYGKTVIGITGTTGPGYEECISAGFDRVVPLKNPTMVTTEAIESLKETAKILFDKLE